MEYFDELREFRTIDGWRVSFDPGAADVVYEVKRTAAYVRAQSAAGFFTRVIVYGEPSRQIDLDMAYDDFLALRRQFRQERDEFYDRQHEEREKKRKETGEKE